MKSLQSKDLKAILHYFTQILARAQVQPNLSRFLIGNALERLQQSEYLELKRTDR